MRLLERWSKCRVARSHLQVRLKTCWFICVRLPRRRAASPDNAPVKTLGACYFLCKHNCHMLRSWGSALFAEQYWNLDLTNNFNYITPSKTYDFMSILSAFNFLHWKSPKQNMTHLCSFSHTKFLFLGNTVGWDIYKMLRPQLWMKLFQSECNFHQFK